MSGRPAQSSLKPRDPRIAVVVPARMRLGARWSDACILNVSARGLLIHAPEPPQRGSYVELRRGEQVIIGRVMWSSGSRAGVRAQDRVPVEAIVTAKAAQSLRLTAGDGRPVERRHAPRHHERSRLRGRAMEFATMAAIGATLSVAAVSMMAEAFAQPLSRVGMALAGQASLPADSR
ncbi:MAG TPA: PilZ domain-containing protein [Sphingomicrobium sp.]|nr:PilZ domain-containing protein [Sphingomicrobium sp.]